MTNNTKIRLKDFVLMIPNDIEIGIIKTQGGKEIAFEDISELSQQYTMDYVSWFDIARDRILFVHLEHN